MRITRIALLAILVIVGQSWAVELAEDAITIGGQEYDVVGQAVGNPDVILVHIGLGDPNTGASWGLAVSHAPQQMAVEQSTSFGAFAQLTTDLIAVGNVPQPYQGLDLKGFVGCDILYDFDADRIQVWPSIGARIAPQATMAFVAMAVYPMGDEGIPSPVDLNEPMGLFGLELRF